MIAMMKRTRLLAWLLALALAGPLPATAQSSAPAQPSGPVAAFTPEQLEQVAAPIALYPDPLLAQVLMASTYPLEIVQAARFVKANPNLTGDQLNEKLKDQTWDDSVKSLTSFPQVLDLLNEKLDWTQKLGDAFLADEKGVLDAVQRLRARAQAEGNLKTTSEQTVTVEPAAAAPPATTSGSQTVVVQQPTSVIKIEPASPQVVYVPSYNPTVVYGAWPYPAYPPYSPYPPGYAWGAAALSFGVGMAVGAAVWGNCNWGGGNVDVDVNRNSNFTRNVNRTEVAATAPPASRSARRGANRSGSTTRRIARASSTGISARRSGITADRTPRPFSRGRPSAGAPSRGARNSHAAAPAGRAATADQAQAATADHRAASAVTRRRPRVTRRRARPGSGRGPGIVRRAGGGGL